MPSLAKIAPACQGSSPQRPTADSSSINAVSFSSARTMKRFRLPRCASAIQIFRRRPTLPDCRTLLLVQHRLRRDLAQFELHAHFLQASSKPFDLLLLRVNLATYFNKL